MPRPDFQPISASPTLRAAYLTDLINQCAELALCGNTPLPLARSMTLSEVTDFFESDAFASYRKMQEGKAKTTIALFGRLDGLMKQLNGLARALSRR